jgi:hypothetical protein
MGHMCAPWDGEECHRGHFPFRPTKSAFSIFGVPKSYFFVRQLLKRLFYKIEKCIWVTYSNSSTFHVESLVRFKNMQEK